jgi:hypothetical protein
MPCLADAPCPMPNAQCPMPHARIHITPPYHLDQFNCRQTPLQTLVVGVIIDTSSEH